MEHARLRLCAGRVNQVLRHAALRHLVLDEGERRLVLADVVGHVPVPVHSQQVGASLCRQAARLLYYFNFSTKGRFADPSPAKSGIF